jgi:hypothetical protein
MSKLNLPEPIAAYFSADQRDGESVARCFTEGAVVEDEGQSHSGQAAIKVWKTAASRKYSYTSEPFAQEQREGRTIVKTRLTGNFPGSPADLQFVFRIERGKIAHLEITP